MLELKIEIDSGDKDAGFVGSGGVAWNRSPTTSSSATAGPAPKKLTKVKDRHVTQATYNLNGRDLRVNTRVNKIHTRDLLCTTWEKTDQRRGSSGSSDGWGIKFMLPVFASWRRTLPNVTVCRS